MLNVLPQSRPPHDRGRAPNRSRFLGGTDAAPILGVSPWTSRMDVWLEKTRRRAPVKPSPERERRFALGHKLEPIVLDMAVHKLREQGREVEVLARNRRYTDVAHRFLSCEVDWELRLDGQHVNGDSKTVTGHLAGAWGDEDTDQIPVYYGAQFQAGMGITAAKTTVVAALIGMDDVAIYYVERDDEVIAGVREKMVDFWQQHVVPDVPPAAQSLADVKALFPIDNGRTRVADDSAAADARALREVKMRLTMLRAKEEQLATKIGSYLGPFAQLAVEGQRAFTLNSSMQTTLDEAALRRARPDLVAMFERSSERRTLRLVQSWGG